MVDQPGAGGDRDTFEGNGITTDVDPGHTFIRLVKRNADGTVVDRTLGFYPAGAVNNPLKKGSSEADGRLVDDTGKHHEVMESRTIDEAAFKAGLEYIDANHEARYNLDDYNCTDFAIGFFAAAGQPLPDTKGYWLGGGGSNPGDLGEDIRALQDQRREPGKK